MPNLELRHDTVSHSTKKGGPFFVKNCTHKGVPPIAQHWKFVRVLRAGFSRFMRFLRAGFRRQAFLFVLRSLKHYSPRAIGQEAGQAQVQPENGCRDPVHWWYLDECEALLFWGTCCQARKDRRSCSRVPVSHLVGIGLSLARDGARVKLAPVLQAGRCLKTF